MNKKLINNGQERLFLILLNIRCKQSYQKENVNHSHNIFFPIIVIVLVIYKIEIIFF